ncbi:MAG: c-type cytochrome [Myxococcales bacterium]|nr:c-type cytochrome [Myxococcales bacterium]
MSETEYSRPSKDRLFEHEFDGIQEYDNPLPGWWKLIFLFSVIFSVGYWAWYHMGGSGESHLMSYKKEMTAFEQWKTERELKALSKLSEGALWKLRSNPAIVLLGQSVFNRPGLCVTCHKADGSGLIGPNLTDDYWVFGNTMMDMYKVVSNGGRPGKGMIAWKKSLKQKELIAVVVYASTLSGKHLKGKAADPNDEKKLGPLKQPVLRMDQKGGR